MMAIGLLAVAAACSGKDTTAVPPDTTITPPPPPPGPNPPPPPPPPAAGPVTVFAAGNISTCGTTRDEATARLIDTTATVFALGDMAFPYGRAADFTNCYGQSWGIHKARTYATLGNHEYDSSATAEYARAYFGERAGSNGKGFFSFNLGAWHVVVLNTGNRAHVDYAGGSEQLAWLQSDLAANKTKCTLAVFHDPRFFSSTLPGYTDRPTLASLWTTLVNGGVDLAVSGNLHHYERLAPMDAAGARDDANGIMSFNVGTGGQAVQAPSHIHPNSVVRDWGFGVLKLTLRDADFDFEFVPIPGNPFTDSGSGTCH
jgi:hypothetical protein